MSECATLFRYFLETSVTEYFCMAAFDGRGCLIDFSEHGDSNAVAVRFNGATMRRMLANPAIRHIMVAHNHPSGQPRPSARDISLTRQLVLSLALLDIALFDHIICTGDGDFSFRAAGLL